MRKIHKFVLAISILAVIQLSAQSTPHLQLDDEDNSIENFQLPTFSELSNDIATDYTNVLESLPDLSTIGEHVKKELRRGIFDPNSIQYTFRNFQGENSFLPNITGKRFQLRDNLNRIMFNGFDANQLHMNEAYKGAN